jgi:hypothetical protein
MTNCSQDTQDINKNDVAVAPKNEISFGQFKNKTGLKNFKNTISLPVVSLNTQAKKVGQNHHTLNDFNIDTTYIKQFIVKNKTTYTFKITPKIVMRNSIFNLNVYNKDGVWETSIIEMIPTDQNYKDLITGNTKQFKGKMRLVYQSTQNQNPINKPYSRSSGTGYTTIFITGNRHCTRTGDCANGTCDNCNLCVDYYSFSMPVDDGEAVEALQESPYIEPQSGGGNGANLTDPSGYVIDPNLFDLSDPNSFIILQTAERAAAFWNDLSDDLKAWAVVNENEYPIFLNTYLATLTQESKDNSRNLITLRICYNNTNTSWEQFENRFMGTSEGQDGEYDAAYWENPNLTFPQQNLPTYNDFVNSFPRNGLGQLLAGADIVYSYIGGEIGQLRFSDPTHTENTCALKVSRALNYSGVIIPNIPGTLKGADNKYYFLNSKELNIWMRKTFGIPSGTNHITGAQAGIHGVNLTHLLKGKEGIYSLVSSDTKWAYGHADFLMPNATCGVYCHFYDAPIDYIDIWILN